MYTLNQTINWARAFMEYAPFTAGFGQEPATSTGNMIRSSLTSAPLVWAWNRGVYQLPSPTVKGTQDYTVATSALPDFGFLEKVVLTDTNGKSYELVDVYNNGALALASDQQKPQAVGLFTQTSASLVFRFMGVPNAAYTVVLIYQKRPISMGPFSIASVAAAVAGNTTYTGVFDALSFPAGATAIITSCTNVANNGSFVVVSCNATTLVVANAAGVLESTSAGFACNFDWSPIPDSYINIYNNLFISEMYSVSNDPQMAQAFRQRGIGAFLSKAVGLSETQKKAFLQQWLAREVEMGTSAQMTTLGNQARGV